MEYYKEHIRKIDIEIQELQKQLEEKNKELEKFNLDNNIKMTYKNKKQIEEFDIDINVLDDFNEIPLKEHSFSALVKIVDIMYDSMDEFADKMAIRFNYFKCPDCKNELEMEDCESCLVCNGYFCKRKWRREKVKLNKYMTMSHKEK